MLYDFLILSALHVCKILYHFGEHDAKMGVGFDGDGGVWGKMKLLL